VSFVNLVEGEIRPRTVTEQLPIALLIKLNCAVLFGFGCGNPLVESCLELSQRRNALRPFMAGRRFSLRLRFFEPSRLANNASPRRTGDNLCFTPIFGPSRSVVFLTAVLEFVGVVRASGAFEYFHQPAARRVLLLTN